MELLGVTGRLVLGLDSRRRGERQLRQGERQGRISWGLWTMIGPIQREMVGTHATRTGKGARSFSLSSPTQPPPGGEPPLRPSWPPQRESPFQRARGQPTLDGLLRSPGNPSSPSSPSSPPQPQHHARHRLGHRLRHHCGHHLGDQLALHDGGAPMGGGRSRRSSGGGPEWPLPWRRRRP